MARRPTFGRSSCYLTISYQESGGGKKKTTLNPLRDKEDQCHPYYTECQTLHSLSRPTHTRQPAPSSGFTERSHEAHGKAVLSIHVVQQAVGM